VKLLTFEYAKTSLITDEELALTAKKLVPIIKEYQELKEHQYNSPRSFIYLPTDASERAKIMEVVEEKKQLKPTALVVIGIGGSNLGTLAVQEAIYGKFYNEQSPPIKFYCADTVDTDYIYDIVLLIEQELEKGNTVLINIVSKSGTTLETIANGELFLQLLAKARPHDYQQYVVITTDKNSPLWNIGQKHHITCLSVPQAIGGRYSVLSAVGLFPLALLGVDITALCKGAAMIIPVCTNTDILDNPAALSAALLYAHYRKGKNIHDTFLFSVDLENMGRWYRQLMGESIGKTNKHHEQIGITPTVSIGTTDLHSVGQLYIGGPSDKFTTFIVVKKNKSDLVVPKHLLQMLTSFSADKTLVQIMNTMVQGVQDIYYEHKRPFVTIRLPAKSELYLGQLLQLKMFEMVYLAHLLEVSPFDQPHVESYKQQTRKLLAHE
jgi:glucose-6-phosphate isomerase